MQFEPVIGLEIHAQLNTKSKLFCSASTEFGANPNTHVTPVSLALPGALPVLNKRAVELAVMAGLAFGCDIQSRSVFARKNYVYPDLPKGYQISQFEHPICLGGAVVLAELNKTIDITRIHMEEDAGKLVHQGANGISGAHASYVDLNRAGVPLIEIVSEPQIQSPKEARLYMERVHHILKFMGVCDGDLEKGSFRCDANISVRPVGQSAFGTRTEVKNLNSFRSIEQSVQYEIDRQISVISSGGTIIQQTMHFDEERGETIALRSKENAHDYRYFPDPDLKPLIVTEDDIASVRLAMREHPDQVLNRLTTDRQLPSHDVKVLMQDVPLLDLFESTCAIAKHVSPKMISKWIVGELNAELKLAKKTTVKAHDLAQIMQALAAKKLSSKMVKDCLPKLVQGVSYDILSDMFGDGQVSDMDQLHGWVDAVMDEHPDVVKKIQGGKVASANFLMGQVMKMSQGRANPDAVRRIILDACARA